MGRKSNVVKQAEAAEKEAAFDSEVEKRLDLKLHELEQRIIAKYEMPAHPGAAPLPAIDVGWARTLAMSIAELTGQGVGREQHVSPDVLERRRESRKLMEELIISAKREGLPATYKVTNKTLLADQVIEPFWVDSAHAQQSTIVDWDGAPNDVLEPQNATAKAIHAAFLASIGSVPKVVPDDPVGTTPSGLVVRGQGIPSMRRVQEVGEPAGASDNARVHNRTQATRTKETRILGSIADPARQTA